MDLYSFFPLSSITSYLSAQELFNICKIMKTMYNMALCQLMHFWLLTVNTNEPQSTQQAKQGV